ncbi:MAG: PAS domain S-box protein [Terriglobia bacterium]
MGRLPTLTHIDQIRSLTLEEAKRGYPVRIRAVVTYCRVIDRDMFIQDSTAGVWVDPEQFNVNVRSGQLIEVEGTAGPGDFAPEIDKSRVRILGETPLPVPRRVSGDELASGRQDSQWVEVEAVVRSAAELGTNLTLNVSTDTLQFRVFVPDYGTPPIDLVDAAVRIRGVFGGTYTPSGLFTGFQLLVPSRNEIQIVRRRSGGLFSLPVRPIQFFLRLTPEGAFTHRVRVQGVVTYQGAGLLCIRDQDAALLIHLGVASTEGPQDAIPPLSGRLTDVKVGDLVDVVGFPDRGEYTPVMCDAVFRRIGVSSPAQPASMSVKEALKGDHDADLVRLRAELLNRTDREGQEVLELQEGNTTFRAEMERQNGVHPLDFLRPGSLLEVTGVRRIEAEDNRLPRAFSLLLRSPADIVVLKRPPWWTASKVLAALAMLMSAVFAVLGWVAVLRRRVRSQTELIRQRLESEADLEKRYQRLFERNLAGVCRTSLDGRLLDCNEALATMLGYGSREQLLGRQISGNLMAPVDREAFLVMLKTERKLSNHETRLQRRDGGGLWVIENASLVDDADGHSPVIESTCIDITERKRVEADLHRYAHDLEIAKAAQERHSAELAHLVEELAHERDLLGTLMDNVPDAIFFKDSQCRFNRINTSQARILGIADSRDALGKTDFDFFPQEDAQAFYALEQKIVASGRPVIGHLERFCDSGGTYHWLSNTEVPVKDEQGRVTGIVGVARDVTEWKSTLEALRESEERYRELFENASDLVYTTDLEFRLTSLNHVGQRTLGYSQEEAPQLDLWRLVDPKHWERIKHGRQRLLAGESDFNVELEVKAKDGRRVILEVKPRFIYKDGKPVGVQGIGRDVTGRDEAEMELRHAQKLESVGRLASGIAHEINTPIQFVGDNTRFLQDSFGGLQTLFTKYQQLRDAAGSGAVSPELLAEVRDVEEKSDCAYLLEEIPSALTQTLDGVTRVATIVRAMKEFAHPEGKEMAAADLNRALLSTLTVARTELKYVADVETELGDLPLVVCNIGDLNQVFLNLLVNAAHAIGDVVKGTGMKGKIRVRTASENNTVLIAISDTGGGIPEAIRGRIFDPFFTTKEVGRGSGQGLAIARSVVVDRHKGTLTLESEVGEGTTFFIRLPLDPTEGFKEIKAS